MKAIIRHLPLIFLLLLPAEAHPQHPSWDDFLHQQLLPGDEDDYTSTPSLIDELTALHLHPISINHATRQSLEQIPFLSPRQVEEILYYLDTHGPLHDVGSLMLIPTLDYDTRQLLSYLVTFDDYDTPPATPSKRWLTHGRNRLMSRMDIPFYTRAGYEPFTREQWEKAPSQHYWGNALYASLRYSYTYSSHLMWNLAVEKDPGEPFLTRGPEGELLNPLGFDALNACIQLKDVGHLRNLTVGSYRLSFGQGLVMNTTFSLGNNAATNALERAVTADPISRNGGTSESDYLHGAAATVRLGEVDVTGFVSLRHLDATLSGDSISTILTTGLHRTSLELSRKHNVRSFLAGGHARYSIGGLHLGATATIQTFDRPLAVGTQDYKRFYPKGDHFANASVDYAWFRPGFAFTGETAVSQGGGFATLGTLRVEPFDRTTLTALFRHYTADYHGLQANAFGQGSEVRGETGVCIGADVQSLRNWRFTARADLCHFPVPRYRVALPSNGADMMAGVTWNPRTDFTLQGQYRCRVKERNVASGYTYEGLFREVTQRIRLQGTLQLSPDWNMQGCVDMCQVNAESIGRGIRLAAKAGWEPSSKHLRLKAECSVFHTTDYASRIYAYEPGLLYAYNYRAFYGQGLRGMMMADLRLFSDALICTVKLSGTHFFDRDNIGSAAQQIPNNHSEDLALQLRYTF